MRPSLPASLLLLLSVLGILPAVAFEPYLVKGINPVPQNTSSSPGEFLSLDSGISLFFANEPGNGIWRSDGTEAGTFQLADERYVLRMVQAGRLAFLRTWPLEDLSGPGGLWVTDGSAGGTFSLLENTSVSTILWVPSRGLLFFTATEETHGLELWRTDGTPAGTWMVKDIAPGIGSSSPAHLIEFKGRLFFQANDGMNGPALWVTDGTEPGTRMMRDPWPGRADHTGPEWPQVAGSKLFFFAPAPGIGEELWVSDGTTRGTRPVGDLVPGPASPQPYSWTALGNRLLVILDTGRGQELWVSDGTRAGTRALTDFEPFQAFGQFPFLSKQLFGKLLPFRVHDGVHGIELWITDGTRAGTRLVKDICPGQCSSDVGFTVFGNRLILGADDGQHGKELWTSDGTAAGTRLLRDVCPGACSSHPGVNATLGGRLLFTAFDAPSALRQLWRTDGTSRGTVRVTSFERGFYTVTPGRVPGAILFQAWDPEHGEELWRSNGTRPGTRLVKDINSNDVGGSSPRGLRAAGSEVFFLADAPQPARCAPAAGGATARPRGLWFAADSPEYGYELWSTDGTAEGTRMMADMAPDGSFSPQRLVSAGDRMFLSGPRS